MGFICYCLVVAVYLFSSCAVCLVAWPQEVEDPSLVTVFSFMLMIMILAFLVLAYVSCWHQVRLMISSPLANRQRSRQILN